MPETTIQAMKTEIEELRASLAAAEADAASGERDAYWAALTEIAFANLDGGPTPAYIREHAKRALQMEGIFPKRQERDDG